MFSGTQVSWCPCRGLAPRADTPPGTAGRGVTGQERRAGSCACATCTRSEPGCRPPHGTARGTALCEFHLQVSLLKGRAGLPGSDGGGQPQSHHQGGGGLAGTWETVAALVARPLGSPRHRHLVPAFYTAHVHSGFLMSQQENGASRVT